MVLSIAGSPTGSLGAEPLKSAGRERFLAEYLAQSGRVWRHLPNWARAGLLGRTYGKHLHALTRLLAGRTQSFGTFFMRNRAELEIMRRVTNRMPHGANLHISILACSKGAEVYSILWTIRTARPDLKITTTAVDISQDIVTFAAKGVYSLGSSREAMEAAGHASNVARYYVLANTVIDQDGCMFGRLGAAELRTMFEVDGALAAVKPWLKEGVTWRCGDASDPELIDALGPQDIVVANNFLCHMDPAAAERCLCNVARGVKPGGYLFVSGVDLDVRARAATRMHWEPVDELVKDIHEGDQSLRHGWPLEYWGLEPFDETRPDWRVRYATVFRIGEVR